PSIVLGLDLVEIGHRHAGARLERWLVIDPTAIALRDCLRAQVAPITRDFSITTLRASRNLAKSTTGAAEHERRPHAEQIVGVGQPPQVSNSWLMSHAPDLSQARTAASCRRRSENRRVALPKAPGARRGSGSEGLREDSDPPTTPRRQSFAAGTHYLDGCRSHCHPKRTDPPGSGGRGKRKGHWLPTQERPGCRHGTFGLSRADPLEAPAGFGCRGANGSRQTPRNETLGKPLPTN